MATDLKPIDADQFRKMRLWGLYRHLESLLTDRWL